MKWQFLPQPRNLVETGVTQRDQFRNDEVDLSDTIVRESVQNSLDAGTNSNTRVSFRWLSAKDGMEPQFVKKIFDGQVGHAQSAGLEIDLVNFKSPSALIIEDFGTSGLTGSVLEKDEENFSDFWRRHGRSHKTGKSRGRWGLGKLVYSSSSLLGVFFGLTVRENDPVRYLMGQSVLDLHTHDGVEYPAHAFFSEMDGDEPSTQIQTPIVEDALVDAFTQNFKLERSTQPGLSIIIPFPNPELHADRMIGVAIASYFYPIITGQLSLTFNGQAITADNIRELAHQFAREKLSDIDLLFDFITEVKQAQEQELLVVKEQWLDDDRLDEDDFEPGDLQRMREQFVAQQIVGIKLPLTLARKDGEKLNTSFTVFVKRPDDLTKGHDLYVRGGLTLPAESKFRDRKAFGAMIAEDEPIASFLGDAENAAHTRWISNAEKLRKNYRAPEKRLKIIRNSVINLYDLLAQAVEEEDERALKKFFWIEQPAGKGGKKPIGPTPPDIPKPPEPTPKPLRLEKTNDGFSIHPGPTATDAEYPVFCVVRAAYDVASGNPFKRYDPRDFKFGSQSGIPVGRTKKTVKILERADNLLKLQIDGPEFLVQVTGFDTNRDLQVTLNTVDG